jgi:Skp family chaperone for outer membrane proteins
MTVAVLAGACSQRTGAPEGGPSATGVGYVDMDALIQEHPLHVQLQAMQDQIGVLQQESSLVPTGLSPQQAAAYDSMQAELNAQAQKFQADLATLRASYQRREALAISQLQATVIGGGASSGGVMGGLQQQFGQQAQELQKQALATFTTYRAELFRQDADHLKHVQQVLGAQMRGRLAQRESQLSAQETAYQVGLVKANQEQRLNLQAKLQDLALSDQQRKQYQDQLSAMDAAEQSKINVMKARNNAEVAALERSLNAQAAAQYDVERARAQSATQAKLAARQKEMQTAMAPQMQALSGKFQQQLNDVNAKLAVNDKYKTQAQAIHDQVSTQYGAEADKATASYQRVRAALIEKYSTIAHMQFQDNETIAAQAEKLAADRRDLYQRIAAQVAAQVEQVARQDGIAVVFDTIRGGGTAVDLTDQVRKAINQQGPAATPASPTSRGT